jgi:hypothetical protein
VESFPLTGKLLSAEELRVQLTEGLKGSTERVLLASAYLKQPALAWVKKNLKTTAATILTRWQPRDLLNGSSDLEAYEFATTAGWSFYVQQDFHGKVYAIPGHAIFVGSANLTERGLNLSGVGNSEVNIRAPATRENLEFVRQLFASAVLLNSDVYERIKTWVEKRRKESTLVAEDVQWPLDLRGLVSSAALPLKLIVDECLHTDGSAATGERPPQDEREIALIRHDRSLLGLNDSSNRKLAIEQLRDALRRLKMYRWLVHRVSRAADQQIFFGALTKGLHEDLLDEPAPYRSDVKRLLANLLGWIQRAEMGDVVIDQPNYSHRIRLL